MCKSNADGGKRCKAHIIERQVALDQEMQKKVIASMGDEEREKTETLMAGYHSQIGEGKLISNEEDRQAKINSLNHPSVVSAKNKAIKLAEQWDEEEAVINKMSAPTMTDKVAFASQFNDEYKELQTRIMGAFINMKNAKDPVERKKFEQEAIKLEQKARDIAYRIPALSKKKCDEMAQNTTTAKQVKESIQNYNKEQKEALSYYQNSLLLNKSSEYKNATSSYINTRDGRELLRKVAENRLQSKLSAYSSDRKKLEEHVQLLEKSRASEDEIKNAKSNLYSVMNNYENLERAYEYTNKHNFLQKCIDENKDIQNDMKLPSILGGSHERTTRDTMVLTAQNFSKVSREYEAKNWWKYTDATSPKMKNAWVARDLYKTQGITSVEAIKNDPKLQHTMVRDAHKYGDRIHGSIKAGTDWLANKYD